MKEVEELRACILKLEEEYYTHISNEIEFKLDMSLNSTRATLEEIIIRIENTVPLLSPDRCQVIQKSLKK